MRIVILTILACIVGFFAYLFFVGENPNDSVGDYTYASLPDSPLEASFVRSDDGTEIKLVGGVYEEIQTVRDPVYGDMNGDGVDDSILLLKDEDTYYLALALKDPDGFLGLTILSLDEKTMPSAVIIKDELVQLSYQERMKYFVLVGTKLEEIVPQGEVYTGTYVYTESLQTFTPCIGGEMYTLSPDSNSLAALKAIYIQSAQGDDPKDTIYIVLAGSVKEPEEGQNSSTFTVSSVLRVPEHGSCPVVPVEEILEDTATESTTSDESIIEEVEG